MKGWISVDDRLPEDNRNVSTFDIHKQIYSIGRYKHKEDPTNPEELLPEWMRWGTMHDAGLSNYIVTHWQPLMEPPSC